jgi:hypothetical protein
MSGPTKRYRHIRLWLNFRVTRWGQFSPVERFYNLWSILFENFKSASPNFWLLFSTLKLVQKIIWSTCIFFSNCFLCVLKVKPLIFQVPRFSAHRKKFPFFAINTKLWQSEIIGRCEWQLFTANRSRSVGPQCTCHPTMKCAAIKVIIPLLDVKVCSKWCENVCMYVCAYVCTFKKDFLMLLS